MDHPLSSTLPQSPFLFLLRQQNTHEEKTKRRGQERPSPASSIYCSKGSKIRTQLSPNAFISKVARTGGRKASRLTPLILRQHQTAVEKILFCWASVVPSILFCFKWRTSPVKTIVPCSLSKAQVVTASWMNNYNEMKKTLLFAQQFWPFLPLATQPKKKHTKQKDDGPLTPSPLLLALSRENTSV